MDFTQGFSTMTHATLGIVSLLLAHVRSAQPREAPLSDVPQPFQLSLKRILPGEFDKQWKDSGWQAVLVLFCQASEGVCGRTERRLANAAALIAAQRHPAGIMMVNTAEEGGEPLLRKFVDEAHQAPPMEPPTMLVFRQGEHPSLYRGSLGADAVASYMATFARGQKADAEPAELVDQSDVEWADQQPADRPLELHTPEQYLQTLSTFPLVFVLFYSMEHVQPTLHANYTAAAAQLFEQNVNVRLARMEVKQGTQSVMIVKELQVEELPDIVIFRNGRATAYQAGAGVLDLIDVARWNAGNSIVRPRNVVYDVDGTAEFEQVLSQHRFVLIAFTTRWCSRCLVLSTELDVASTLLASAEPPVALASVNIDAPVNRPLLERFGVLLAAVLLRLRNQAGHLRLQGSYAQPMLSESESESASR